MLYEYNLKTGCPCVLGNQFDHKKTTVKFSGYKKERDDSTMYFKLRTSSNNWLIPLSDMEWLVTQPMTLYRGVWDGQLMEYTEDMVLVGNSNMFEVVVNESIEAGADYEVHDPELDLWAAKLTELYNLIEGKLERGELKGEPGYTPRKGIDYFTQDDIDQIAQEASEKVPPYDDTEIREGIADVKADFRKLDSDVKAEIAQLESSKMEFYEVAYEGGHIVKDGVVQTYAMLKEKFDNPKYWLYLHHVGVNFLPLGTSDSTEYLQFNAEYDVTSGIRYESISIDGNDVVTTKFKTFEVTDNKVASVNNRNKDSEDKYPSVKAMTGYTYSKAEADAELSKRDAHIAEVEEKNDALWKLSEGQVYDIVEEVEEGATTPPTGAKYMTVEDVRGNTDQAQYKGYQLVDVNSAIEKHVDGVTLTPIKNDDGLTTEFVIDGTESTGSYKSLIINDSFELDAGSYVVGSEEGNDNKHYIGVYTSKWSLIGNQQNGGKFNLSQKTSGLRLRIYIAGGASFSNFSVRPFVVKQSSPMIYEPYTGGIPSPNPEFPQKIESVEELNILHTGKNLLNASADAITEKNNTTEVLFNNGEITVACKSTWGSDYLMFNTIALKHDITYNSKLFYNITGSGATTNSRCGMLIRAFDKNGEPLTDKEKVFNNATNMYWTAYNTYYKAFTLSPQKVNNNDYTRISFALTDDVSYVTIGIRFSSEAIGDVCVVKDAMLYTGEEETYEPYREESRTITPPRHLNAIGEYRDVCDVDDGVWKYNIKKIVLDGSENWGKRGLTQADVYQTQEPELVFGTAAILNPCLCNKYIRSGASVYPSFYTMGHGFISIAFAKTGTSTASDISNYLREQYQNGDPVIVYAPINEIKEEPISESVLAFLRSLENLPSTDNIFITDNHGRDVSFMVEYIRKLSEVVS